jgi:hypothetical protein
MEEAYDLNSGSTKSILQSLNTFLPRAKQSHLCCYTDIRLSRIPPVTLFHAARFS